MKLVQFIEHLITLYEWNNNKKPYAVLVSEEVIRRTFGNYVPRVSDVYVLYSGELDNHTIILMTKRGRDRYPECLHEEFIPIQTLSLDQEQAQDELPF